MKQSKAVSLIETLSSTAIGFGFAMLINYLLLPVMFGVQPTSTQNIIYVTVFTVASVLRGYFVRRFFECFHSHLEKLACNISNIPIAISRTRHQKAKKTSFRTFPFEPALHAWATSIAEQSRASGAQVKKSFAHSMKVSVSAFILWATHIRWSHLVSKEPSSAEHYTIKHLRMRLLQPWYIRILLMIGFVRFGRKKITMDYPVGDGTFTTHPEVIIWPFHAAPAWAFRSWRDFRAMYRTFGVFYVFRNLPGVIKWYPGVMLPARWGFGICGFEFGHRG